MDWIWVSGNHFTLTQLVIVVPLVVFGPAVVVTFTTLAAASDMSVRGRGSTMIRLDVLAIMVTYVVATLAVITGLTFFPKFNAIMALYFGSVGAGMLTITLGAAWCWTHSARSGPPNGD